LSTTPLEISPTDLLAFNKYRLNNGGKAYLYVSHNASVTDRERLFDDAIAVRIFCHFSPYLAAAVKGFWQEMDQRLQSLSPALVLMRTAESHPLVLLKWLALLTFST
jgi:hypothetical protein